MRATQRKQRIHLPDSWSRASGAGACGYFAMLLEGTKCVEIMVPIAAIAAR